MTTRSAGHWLVPLELERIDQSSVPEGHSLMVRGRNPALVEESDRQVYERGGYTDLFRRLDPLEPPQDRRFQRTGLQRN